MRWGYAHALGPFEFWDALGFLPVVERLRKEGRAVPANVERMAAAGAAELLPEMANYFDLTAGGYKPLEPRPGIARVRDFKRADAVVKRNPGRPSWNSATGSCAWSSTARRMPSAKTPSR